MEEPGEEVKHADEEKFRRRRCGRKEGPRRPELYSLVCTGSKVLHGNVSRSSQLKPGGIKRSPLRKVRAVRACRG